MDMTLPNRCVWKFPGQEALGDGERRPQTAQTVTAGDCGQLGEKGTRGEWKVSGN